MHMKVINNIKKGSLYEENCLTSQCIVSKHNLLCKILIKLYFNITIKTMIK